MDAGSIISIAALGLGVITGYVKLMQSLATQKVKVDLLWEAWVQMAKDAAKILHTPHPENLRRDQLLEKFLEQNIMRWELAELIIILKKIIEEKGREFGERQAASQLLRAIEMQYQL